MSEAVHVPWATWSAEEPTGEVARAYEAYLSLLEETVGPGAAQRKEWLRRMQAWVQAHVDAGHDREVARRAFDRMETEETERRQQWARDQRAKRRYAEGARKAAERAAYNAPEAVAERRATALAKAESEARAAAWQLGEVVKARVRIAAIADDQQRDESLLRMLWEAAKYLEWCGAKKAAKLLYEEREPLLEGLRARRAAAHKEMEAAVKAVGGYGKWCWIEDKKGRTGSAIAREVGLSKERVSQHIARESGREVKRRVAWRKPRATRPIDMGGVRGVWLHYELGDQL